MKTSSLKSSLIGKVRTRIAPSPTGFPHVGTAFQALFDWVYAKRYQGHFLMRIEDTDQKRFIAEAETVLHQAFEWLGIYPDEGPDIGGEFGPYRQSERLSLYQQYAEQLVQQGHAYHCFCSSERLDQLREQQRRDGIPPKYDQHCLHLDPAEVQTRLSRGEKSVIRLRVPQNQDIKVMDKLRGEIKFDSNLIDDQVLLKSDGFPTYHLAVVVDDHLMGITHIVRGEEWLPSAPKHVLLYQYLGWPMPELIHTPTLRNTDRSKLSKRKGNTSVWWYREHGYLPQALINFLALMVWKPADQQEIFSLERMIKEFEWEKMNITGPIFDLTKLEWLNGKYIRQLSATLLLQTVSEWMNWVVKNGQDSTCIRAAQEMLIWQRESEQLFNQAVKLCYERARTIFELNDLMQPFFAKSLSYDLADLLQQQTPELISTALTQVITSLELLGNPNSTDWEATVRQVADRQGLSHKTLFMSMRSALTARQYTPPLYEMMTALGWQESLKRLRQAISFISPNF